MLENLPNGELLHTSLVTTSTFIKKRQNNEINIKWTQQHICMATPAQGKPARAERVPKKSVIIIRIEVSSMVFFSALKIYQYVGEASRNNGIFLYCQ